MNPKPAYAVIVMAAACSYLAAAELLPGATGSLTVTIYLVTSICMIWLALQHRQQPVAAREILWLGIFLRLLLLAVPVYTTHDVTRYLWDGAVLLHGFDPYQLHPDHPSLATLRSWWPTPEEHAAYPTLYPPVALGLYAAAASTGPTLGVWVWKLISCSASVMSLLMIDRVLIRHRLRHHLPWMALSPIALYEAGVGAHIDVIATLFVCLAIWAWSYGRLFVVGLSIVLGAATKLLPIVLLAPLCVHVGVRGSMRLLSGAATALCATYGIAIIYGLQPIGSLVSFFSGWRFGSPLYAAVAATLPPAWINWLLASVVLLSAAVICYRSRRDLLGGCMIALSVPLLISPVVFPWYLMILVPFVALKPNRWLIVWLCLAPLTYEVLDLYNSVNQWQPAQWPLWLIAAGWLLAGLHMSYQNTLGSRRSNTPAGSRPMGTIPS